MKAVKVRDFLIKHQRLLTYLSIFAAFVLLFKLVYDDIYIDHDNPIFLAILIGILVLCTIASYLDRRRHMLANFILESSDCINLYALDLNFRYIGVNRNDARLMQEIFGFTPRHDESPMQYLGKEEAAILKSNVDRAKKGETFTFMDTIKVGDKTLYWENLYSPIYNNKKEIIGVFCIVLDVTKQRLKELEMRRLAYEDHLTQVYNRRYIELAYNECVLNKIQEITVIMADLDKFKEANDTYGHAKGDEILVKFGEVLTQIMPQNATVARLGGDEFAVLLPGVSAEQASFLMKLIQVDMVFNNLGVTVSLGAYTDSYQSGKSFMEFCSMADRRMYEDKNQKGQSR